MKIIELLLHPLELWSILCMLIESKSATQLPKEVNLAFCFDILRKVSRSFTIVINQLPILLKNAICIFYLALRALDTIEDDMSIPEEEKISLLLNFHTKLKDSNFALHYGTGDYKRLLENFSYLSKSFLSIDKKYQDIIVDISKRMGCGMAHFIQKDVITVEDYDLYCHYVAGLVGEGLTKMFLLSGLEDSISEDNYALSNAMGLFLQKVNITRDYLEDIMEEPMPRMFWPKDIWNKYASNLEDFKHIKNERNAVKCLNEMITNGLFHVPECLKYLKMLKNKDIIRFCAIPQIMAIGTFSCCYNNADVFKKCLKMRRGEVCTIFKMVTTLKDVYEFFHKYCINLKNKLAKKSHYEGFDIVDKETIGIVEEIMCICVEGLQKIKANKEFKKHKFVLSMHYKHIFILIFFVYILYAWNFNPEMFTYFNFQILFQKLIEFTFLRYVLKLLI